MYYKNKSSPYLAIALPNHPEGFWSVFAVRSKGSQGPKLSSCRHRRFWSDWADAQADLSLRWVYVVGFDVHGVTPSSPITNVNKREASTTNIPGI